MTIRPQADDVDVCRHSDDVNERTPSSGIIFINGQEVSYTGIISHHHHDPDFDCPVEECGHSESPHRKEAP